MIGTLDQTQTSHYVLHNTRHTAGKKRYNLSSSIRLVMIEWSNPVTASAKTAHFKWIGEYTYFGISGGDCHPVFAQTDFHDHPFYK